ncbi:hypothetical protein GCM10009720_13370 [Yaniella flava]|uniref:Uncharacterized protein n=1 Tax=Yaniella flava TaxID=287930 RepID=A0ABP5FWK6_9MICC|nr:hypothetical protein [Micrococcaceae bacterium]
MSQSQDQTSKQTANERPSEAKDRAANIPEASGGPNAKRARSSVSVIAPWW